MIILGINEGFHETAAAIIKDGKIITAIEEEKLNRERHTSKYPSLSIQYCLQNAGVKLRDVDYIAYSLDMKNYISPFPQVKYCLNWFLWSKNPIIRNTFRKLPHTKSLEYLIHQFVTYLKRKKMEDFLRLREKICRKHKVKYRVIDHHLTHAASTFNTSPFRKSNILVIDSRGEKESISLAVGKGNDIEMLKYYPVTQSLGQFYTLITILIGLGKHGEGKTMGLAPYGKPDERFKQMIKINKNEYEVNYDFLRKLNRYARFGGELTKDHKNIAATAQWLLEQIGLKLTEELYDMTGIKNLCLAGGVTLNCSMNGVLLQSEFIDGIYIQPAANDAGAALGAAIQLYSEDTGKFRDHMKGAYTGPSFTNEDIVNDLKSSNLKYEYYDDIEGVTADLLSKGIVLGWFQGGLEWGPRALGSRSILSDPTNEKMKKIVNDIKHRERWRPFAPSIVAEDKKKYLENPYDSPFMILNFNVIEDFHKVIPVVTHVDGTARVQTVEKDINPRYHKLLKKFQKEKGVSVVTNTSFNDKGEPLVCTPKQAIESFKKMSLYNLVIGNYVVKKAR